MDRIKIGHGSGGLLTRKLIREVFQKRFNNSELLKESDGATISPGQFDLVVTTDAFVVDPLFFPGGDIGKMSVCGTINDLVVSGARPLYLTASFILEEGLDIAILERITDSMAHEADLAGIPVIAGDTKVVPGGNADKLYITTTGIGEKIPEFSHLSAISDILPGDRILVSGPVGLHGAAIFASRFPDRIQTDIRSDCASLLPLLGILKKWGKEIRFMRDATRGGLATVLNEIADQQKWGLVIEESDVLVTKEVSGLCELSGLDPLYLANEGTMVLVVSSEGAEAICESMNRNPQGYQGIVIGECNMELPGRVKMRTRIGGSRILPMLSSDPLPRIC